MWAAPFLLLSYAFYIYCYSAIACVFCVSFECFISILCKLIVFFFLEGLNSKSVLFSIQLKKILLNFSENTIPVGNAILVNSIGLGYDARYRQNRTLVTFNDPKFNDVNISLSYRQTCSIVLLKLIEEVWLSNENYDYFIGFH